MSQRVLVTGATGFVGSRLTARLIAEGHRVRGLARSGAGAAALSRTDVEPALGDLRNRSSLTRALRGIDVVYHLAAAMRGGWREAEESSIRGTLWLLEEARRAGVQRFVHISSLAVYQTSNLAPGAILDERSPLEPQPRRVGPYCYGKSGAERHAWAAAEAGLDVAIVRPGLIYGPGGRTMFPHVGFPVGRHLFVLIGSGRNLLPLTYLDHAVDGIVRAGEQAAAVGRAFNFVDDEVLTQRAYLHEWMRARGERRRIIRLPLAILAAAAHSMQIAGRLPIAPLRRHRLPTAYGLRSKYADVRYDARRARRELSWRPHVSLSAALQRTLAPPSPSPSEPLVQRLISHEATAQPASAGPAG